MCLAVYLATPQPVPLVPWNEAARAFNLELVDTTHCSIPALTQPYVYAVGSHLGCGCGFSYTGVEADDPSFEAVHENYQQLAAYLTEHIRTEPVELFVCWSGDETQPPLSRITTTPACIADGTIRFEEGQLMIVRPERSAHM